MSSLKEKIKSFRKIISNVCNDYFSPLKRRALIRSARSFAQVLAELEKIPVQFSADDRKVLQMVNMGYYLDCAARLLSDLEELSATREYLRLKLATVALKYRLEGINGGLDKTVPDKDLLADLTQRAEEWKRGQIFFADKRVGEEEMRVLSDTASYPEFAELILRDSSALEEFFNWSLRDGNKIEIFIQYPNLRRRIVTANLSARIGQTDRELLKIKLAHSGQDPEFVLEKVVTLAIEGEEENILDGGRVHLFRGYWALTVDEIFAVFANKPYEFGNLEISSEGIVNWSVNRWGYWDERLKDHRLVELNNADWLDKLPVLEKLSLREVKSRFNAHLDGRQWGVAITATRRYLNLDFEETHAFLRILIPDDRGAYRVYSFGKYANSFPPTLLQALWNIGKTSDANVAYPDENIFYTHREHASYAFAVSESQGRKLLDLIRKDMLRARAGHFVYQLASENCARWGFGKLRGILPAVKMVNFFEMYFLDSEPHGLMHAIFCVLKSLSRKWQIYVTTRLHYLFGASKGKWIIEDNRLVKKALNRHSFWRDLLVFHPAKLHALQIGGVIGKYAAMGITCLLVGLKAAFSGFMSGWKRTRDLILGVYNNKIINNILNGNAGVEYASFSNAGLTVNKGGSP